MKKPVIEVGQIAGDCVGYGEAKPGLHYQLATVTHDYTCIHDPRYDESGIHETDPSNYSMTGSEVNAIISINSHLIDLHNKLAEFLENIENDTVKEIQKTLGVESGDLASHYFSDDSWKFQIEQSIGEKMAKYAIREFENIGEPAIDQIKKVTPPGLG